MSIFITGQSKTLKLMRTNCTISREPPGWSCSQTRRKYILTLGREQQYRREHYQPCLRWQRHRYAGINLEGRTWGGRLPIRPLSCRNHIKYAAKSSVQLSLWLANCSYSSAIFTAVVENFENIHRRFCVTKWLSTTGNADKIVDLLQTAVDDLIDTSHPAFRPEVWSGRKTPRPSTNTLDSMRHFDGINNDRMFSD